ncbi:hypothetical protein Tco_0378727 [Tanacetum coccineum]
MMVNMDNQMLDVSVLPLLARRAWYLFGLDIFSFEKIEVVELVFDWRERDKPEVELTEIVLETEENREVEFDLKSGLDNRVSLVVVSCGGLRDHILNIISINIASVAWTVCSATSEEIRGWKCSKLTLATIRLIRSDLFEISDCGNEVLPLSCPKNLLVLNEVKHTVIKLKVVAVILGTNDGILVNAVGASSN